jgi:two-component system chemotaxis response regulator CheY
MKILVVDDEESMERLLLQRFRKEIKTGLLELVFARSGEQALNMFHSENLEVVMILSDINMPGMSGLELLEKIRKQNSEIVIYMISAYENEEYKTKSDQLGANGFIPKPLNFDELKNLLKVAEEKGKK